MSTPTPKVPGASLRPGGRSAAVRRAVLDACADLVAQRGLDGLSVAAVAASSRVHESSIYRRWGSVEEIIVDALLDAVGEAGPAPDSGSLEGDLILVLTGLEAFLQTPLGQVALQMSVAPRTASERRIRELYLAGRQAWIVGIVDRATARGEVDDEIDLHALMELLLGPTFVRAAFGVASAWSIRERVRLAIAMAPRLAPARRRR